MLLYEPMPDYRKKEGSLLREHLPDEKFFAEMEKRIRMADDIINQIADIEQWTHN